MFKRHSYDNNPKKIPIKSLRNTLSIVTVNQQIPALLNTKYISISINAFQFRKVQNILMTRHVGKQLNYLTEQDQHLVKYYSFNGTKNRIKGVITERVENDYLFGITFHRQWKVVQRYIRIQIKMKKRNLFNEYYFSQQPPKISVITQPTTTTLYTVKGPESNSTIELKALTKNIDIMLRKKSPGKASHSRDRKNKNQKSEKSRKKLRVHEQLSEETYGLKNYKKNGKNKIKARGSLSRGNYCMTPQPHVYQTVEYLGISPLQAQARFSQRKNRKRKSNSKRNSTQSYGRKG